VARRAKDIASAFEDDAELDAELDAVDVANEYTCPYLLPRPLCERWIVRPAGRGIFGAIISLGCRIMSCAGLVFMLICALALGGLVIKTVVKQHGVQSIAAMFEQSAAKLSGEL